MSSASDPQVKNQAEEQAADEPNSKKAKLDADAAETTTTTNLKALDAANNGNTANDENQKSNLAGNNDSAASKQTPIKTINGDSANNNNNNAENENVDDVDSDDDDGDESGNVDGIFDPKIAKSLEQVENIQLEICNLNETASEEILKVEQKFNKLRRPHFEKRNELLKEIPNFWLTSLANHPIIAPMIESAEDEDCLHYMINLDVEEFEDIKSGYKLKLYFTENPYITNEVIVKEFRLLSSDDVLSSATPIEYKNTLQGKNLKRVVENSIAQYRRSRARPGQTQQSFFAWLVEPTESGGGPDEVAEILKDQIWPNPLEFFFATPDDYGVGTDDESDDDDEEIEDEDIDDDEDDDAVITGGNIDFSDEELEGDDDEDDDDEADDEEEVVE